MPWLSVNQTWLADDRTVPTPGFALEVQRGERPGPPGAAAVFGRSFAMPVPGAGQPTIAAIFRRVMSFVGRLGGGRGSRGRYSRRRGDHLAGPYDTAPAEGRRQLRRAERGRRSSQARSAAGEWW